VGGAEKLFDANLGLQNKFFPPAVHVLAVSGLARADCLAVVGRAAADAQSPAGRRLSSLIGGILRELLPFAALSYDRLEQDEPFWSWPLLGCVYALQKEGLFQSRKEDWERATRRLVR